MAEAKPTHLERRLTPQQARAMQAFRGNGGNASGGCVWGEGVRPWPTMSNLETKGLCVATEWLDEDAGYLYVLTSAGAQWLIEQDPEMSDRLASELLYEAAFGDVAWEKRNA